MSKYFSNGNINGDMSGYSEVERILGKKVFRNKYPTNNYEEYCNMVDGMNLMELRGHCIETTQRVPRGDRRTIVQRLKSEFKKHLDQCAMETQMNIDKENLRYDNENSERVDEALKILKNQL